MTVVLGPTWAYVQLDKPVTLQWNGLWNVISLQTLCWERDKSRSWNKGNKFCRDLHFTRIILYSDNVEFNTVDFVESRLLPKRATNRQQSGVDCCWNGRLCCRYGQLCCRLWQQICNKLNSTACCGRQCRQLGRLCRPNVERPFDFVASVYVAKATRSTLSTFNKVDRVEFNFVASVYRALETLVRPVHLWTSGSSLSPVWSVRCHNFCFFPSDFGTANGLSLNSVLGIN